MNKKTYVFAYTVLEPVAIIETVKTADKYITRFCVLPTQYLKDSVEPTVLEVSDKEYKANKYHDKTYEELRKDIEKRKEEITNTINITIAKMEATKNGTS